MSPQSSVLDERPLRTLASAEDTCALATSSKTTACTTATAQGTATEHGPMGRQPVGCPTPISLSMFLTTPIALLHDYSDSDSDYDFKDLGGSDDGFALVPAFQDTKAQLGADASDGQTMFPPDRSQSDGHTDETQHDNSCNVGERIGNVLDPTAHPKDESKDVNMSRKKNAEKSEKKDVEKNNQKAPEKDDTKGVERKNEPQLDSENDKMIWPTAECTTVLRTAMKESDLENKRSLWLNSNSASSFHNNNTESTPTPSSTRVATPDPLCDQESRSLTSQGTRTPTRRQPQSTTPRSTAGTSGTPTTPPPLVSAPITPQTHSDPPIRMPRLTLQQPTPPRPQRLPTLRLSLEQDAPVLPEIVVSPLAVPGHPATPSDASMVFVGRETSKVQMFRSTQLQSSRTEQNKDQPTDKSGDRATQKIESTPMLDIPCTHLATKLTARLPRTGSSPEVDEQTQQRSQLVGERRGITEDAKLVRHSKVVERKSKPSLFELGIEHATVAERRKLFEINKVTEPPDSIRQQANKESTVQHPAVLEHPTPGECPTLDMKSQPIPSQQLTGRPSPLQTGETSKASNQGTLVARRKMSLDDQAKAFEQSRQTQRMLGVRSPSPNPLDVSGQPNPAHGRLAEKSKSYTQSKIPQRATRSPTPKLSDSNVNESSSAKQPAVHKAAKVEKPKLAQKLRPVKPAEQSSSPQQPKLAASCRTPSPELVGLQIAKATEAPSLARPTMSPTVEPAATVDQPNVNGKPRDAKTTEVANYTGPVLKESQSERLPVKNANVTEGRPSPDTSPAPELDEQPIVLAQPAIVHQPRIEDSWKDGNVYEQPMVSILEVDKQGTYHETLTTEQREFVELPAVIPLERAQSTLEQQSEHRHHQDLESDPTLAESRLVEPERPNQPQIQNLDPEEHDKPEETAIAAQPTVVEEVLSKKLIVDHQIVTPLSLAEEPERLNILEDQTIGEHQTTIEHQSAIKHQNIVEQSILPQRANPSLGLNQAPAVELRQDRLASTSIITRAVVGLCRWLFTSQLEPESEPESEPNPKPETTVPKVSGLKPLLLQAKATKLVTVVTNDEDLNLDVPPAVSSTDQSIPNNEDWDHERLSSLIAELVVGVPAPTDSDKAITLARDWAIANGMEMAECSFEEPKWFEW